MLTSFFIDIFKFVMWMGILIAAVLIIGSLGFFKTIVLALLILILFK